MPSPVSAPAPTTCASLAASPIWNSVNACPSGDRPGVQRIVPCLQVICLGNVRSFGPGSRSSRRPPAAATAAPAMASAPKARAMPQNLRVLRGDAAGALRNARVAHQGPGRGIERCSPARTGGVHVANDTRSWDVRQASAIASARAQPGDRVAHRPPGQPLRRERACDARERGEARSRSCAQSGLGTLAGLV